MNDTNSTTAPANQDIDPKLRRRVRELLHRSVDRVEHPGGRRRESSRLWLSDGRSVIATMRKSLERATLEKRILRALAARDLPAPRLLGSKRHLLLQQDMGGERLSQALHVADASLTRRLLDDAIGGLGRIHRTASEAGLDTAVPERGHDKDWIVGLLRQPRIIGEHMEIKAPRLPKAPLVDRLAVRQPRFIKWDARPGNALVDDAGSVIWIDWEHAGSRNRIDDLAWLLADEYVADDADMEDALLADHLARFADDLSPNEAREYLHVFGTYHSSVRLGYILRYFYRDNQWWSIERCLRKDKIGVTLHCARTVCRRAARWAEGSALTAPLAGWYRDVARKLPTL